MSDISIDRRFALSPAKRALLEKRLGKGAVSAGTQIPVAARDSAIPASFSQERMWLIQQLDPGSVAYNSQVAIHFEGALDVPALERSLAELIRRHEIYRTSFVEVNGQVTQRIHAPHPAFLRKLDLESVPLAEREAVARRAIQEETSRPFRMDQLPLVRWTLLRLDSVRYTLVWMDHHAVTDGWSHNVALQELMVLYAAFVITGPHPNLPAPRLQFADFSSWQRQWMTSAEARSQIEYWRQKLAGSPALLDLPLDRPRPARPSYRGGHETMLLDDKELRPLRGVAAFSCATMFMTFLTAFLVMLHRYCRSDDICVGTGIANRRLPDTDNIIGMLINTVVLRADLSGNPSFRELLDRVRSLTIEAYTNQEAPFHKIVEAVAASRYPGVNPLHQVTFNFQNNPMPAMSFPELSATLERPLFNGSAKFDLYVAGWPRSEVRRGAWQRDDEAVLLSWEYNADVFDVSTVRHMQVHFRNILAEAGRHPDWPIADLRMDDETERRISAVEDNKMSITDLQDQCVHALFMEHAMRDPAAIAVISGDRKWTYGELDERSSRLASHLRCSGVGPDSLVAIFMDRSPEMIAGLLGILKAGGAYAPLDPVYPTNLLAARLAECRPDVVLTTRGLASRLPRCDARIVITEESLSVPEGTPLSHEPVSSDRLAYVLFTSGSTGEAKAVAVPHRGVVRLVKGPDFARMDASQVWLQSSPISFDASTLEIWAPLCNGGRLVLMLPGLPSLTDIGATIRENHVTSAWLSAGLFQLMASERLEDLSGLEQLLTGGDVVSVEAARKVMDRFPSLRLINGYGPTENTTFTCCHTVQPEDLRRRSLPIGRAISHTTVFIFDTEGRPCPVGVPGELCTGGAGLARGYWNNPEATAERFFTHKEFGRLYRTGDLCRHLPGGAIEFLGRMDRQVKVRGYRIEPGEVEAALHKHPAVRACVVIACGDTAAEKFLAAYIVPRNARDATSPEDLRLFLRQYLPDHALPSSFQLIEKILLTPNGKIDHHALPAFASRKASVVSPSVQPRTPIEDIVANVWKEVLARGDIGIHDDFFQANGHSLAALKVLSLIKARTGIELRALDFFEQPTIAGIAARAERRIADLDANSGTVSFLVELRAHGTGSPLLIVPGGWGEANEILVFAALLSHLSLDRPMYAVRSRATDSSRPMPERLEQQVEDVLRAVEAVTPKGPFAILGECAASTLALSLAKRAENLGRTIDAIVLLDPGPVSHLRSVTERVARQSVATDPTQAPNVLPPAVAKYYGLLGSWEPQPLRSPLHLVLSSRFSDSEAITESWRPLAQGPLHVHRTVGDHNSYIREHASHAARLLEEILAGRHG